VGAWSDFLKDGGVYDVEYRLRCRDGQYHWLSVRGLPIREKDGRIREWVGTYIDITERKNTEEALRATAAELLEAQRIGGMGSWYRDLKTDTFTFSEQLCRILGTDPTTQPVPLSQAESLFSPETGTRILQTAQSFITAGEPAKLEVEFRRPDGTTGWFLLHREAVRDQTGNVIGIRGVALDITDQEQAAALLEESEKRFRAVYDRAPVGIALVDVRNGQFLQVNPKLCEITARTESELLAMRYHDITHPEDRENCEARTSQLIEGSLRAYDTEKRYLRPDGTVVHVSLSVMPMWGAGETPRFLMTIVQDISERRRAEEALRESEERLRLAQQAAGIGVFERNMQTGGCLWSPEMEDIYGLPRGKAPKTVEDLMQLVYPEDRASLQRLLDESVATGTAAGEWRVLWPDGSLHWVSGRWRMFKDDQGRPLRAVGVDMDITERKQAEEALRAAKEKLAEEKLYLEHEIDTELGFEDIIGKSQALKTVMENVSKVAASDATVLLLGETGTGKELMARAIHRLSRRAGKAFIKMNCAAIPSGLLESELFGNEKGAFTGAVSKKIGRLELADQGTIFLDEIGEISLALQPKLLRVLQDQEFERLGGTKTLKVDFRLIAATNRNLVESVREKEFRSDLYYRLNVFPIFLPPLRERREDIPLLVEHFMRKIARRMNKSVRSIPDKTMDALIQWHWPGNVRELENFIERSLILTRGRVLNAPLSELQASPAPRAKDETLQAAERLHILDALRESRGLISGPRGAATRLGLKRTTLQSKLKQMGINPRVLPPQA